MKGESVLIFDIETDSVEVDNANLKFFGAYSYLTNQYYTLDYTQKAKIQSMIKNHNVVIGFNIEKFDIPIMERFGVDFEYKIIRDLFILSLPRERAGKGRLGDIGIQLKSYSLDSINKELKLSDTNKGEIDYNLFKRDKWNSVELNIINNYLITDIYLTKKLYEFYEELHAPLKKFLSPEHLTKKIYLNSVASSLGYQVICDMCGIPVIWGKEEKRKKFSGGHHVSPRYEKVKGNIIHLDVASAYPHAIVQGNLFSHTDDDECWNGNGYYNLTSKYRKDSLGKIETALIKLLKLRLEAKQRKDKSANQSLKLVINCVYGASANPKFVNLYNINTASDCTSIVATWVRKLSKTLEEDGYIVLYGFTDSFFVKTPTNGSKEELQMIIDEFLKDAKANLPFPTDTFQIPVEECYKFMWFVKKQKNVYLKVTDKGEVKYTATLMNNTTPKAVKKVFTDYICPKILKELDVRFSNEELKEVLMMELENNPSIACKEIKVKHMSQYKSKTDIRYLISEKYGEGTHKIITNTAMVGVGKNKKYRHCSEKDFIENNLDFTNIYTKPMLNMFRKFVITDEQRCLE